jgi:PKD repeat protein
MKSLKTVLLVGVSVLVLAVLVVPVSGGLVIAEQGAIITSTTGATSPVIQVTGSPIASGGTITIDASWMAWEFASYSLADTNIEVLTTAAAPVVWTPVIDPLTNIVTLTSSGGDTLVGDNITVTFKGTATEPWASGTGDVWFPVTVTRTDTSDTVDFNFEINTPAAATGLTVTDGAVITTTTGASSPVITIIDSPLPQDGTISMDVENLGIYTAGNQLTNANVEVTSSAAAPVVWTRSVSPDGKTLTLTSTGGATAVDDTVTVTLTGTGGNPWIPGLGGATLTAIRDDTADTADFQVQINIPLPGGLMATNGGEIITPTDSTSPVITITNAPIAKDGTITIDISGINPYVAGGHLRNTNVQISDTAAAATWTSSVAGNILTLTSTGGATAADETVTVTFTGAGGTRWVANTGAERVIPLTATRQDTLETASFNFVIDTGGRPVTDFFAAPRSGIIPVTVAFTDLSSGGPNEWNWTFGDDEYSELHNPSHTYTTSGLYTVSLNATNTRGSTIRSKADYIDVYTAGVSQANTVINGLTITNCGGPQTVTVDTSVVRADLIPDKYALEIQPPAHRGLKNITIYAQNGVGFTRNGNLITGSPTGVHLVSADIAPATGFSPDIGTNAAFNWSADLSSYPCNAVITTNIRERITPQNNALLIRIGNGNSPPAVPKGTAYSATITRTNFPPSVPVKIHASINPGWRTSLDPTSTVFIWRISDYGNTGQILPTQYLSTDPVNNLDYYEADSPLGMSTFGLSAFTGNNNPFQLITLAVAAYIAPENPAAPPNMAAAESETAHNVTAAPSPAATVSTTQTTAAPLPTLASQTVTAKIYTNQDGLVTQETTVASKDGYMTITVPKGVIAKGSDGKPLLSISLTPVSRDSLPGPVPAGAVLFAGRAFEIQPDGATFSPGISLGFVFPADAQLGQDFTVKMFDHTSGTWQDVPTVYDTSTGLVTAQVSRFCCFALFAKSPTTEQPAVSHTAQPRQTAVPVHTSVPSSAMSIFSGLVDWVISQVTVNPLIVAVIVVFIIAVVLYEMHHKRGW